MTAAQALLLDVGVVLFKSAWECADDFEDARGLARGTIPGRGPLNPAIPDPGWARYQADEITERDYWMAYAQAAVDNGVDISGFDGFMQAIFREPGVESIRPEALALMAECTAAGRALGILSNELMSFQGRDWVEAQDWYADFAVVIDASELGVRKPDPRPYEAALEALQLPADQVVFIDDNPTYVEAGRATGMRSIWLDVLDPGAAFEAAAVELGLR